MPVREDSMQLAGKPSPSSSSSQAGEYSQPKVEKFPLGCRFHMKDLNKFQRIDTWMVVSFVFFSVDSA